MKRSRISNFELRNQHIQGFENTDMFLLKNSWCSPFHLAVRGSRQSRSQRSLNLICYLFRNSKYLKNNCVRAVFCLKKIWYNRKMSIPKLSVIIPAYNEEKRLPKTLESVISYLAKQTYQSEVLVVNDGSKDGTATIVRELAKNIPSLRLLDNQENHGKGFVVRQGMLAAKGEWRVFMDADNSTSIDHIHRMWLEKDQGFEVIIGSRDIKGAVIPVPQSWLRRRLGDVFNLMVQVLSELWGIWDTQCGFKGFSAKATQEIFSKATVNRWAFDVELLVIAKKHGYKVKEIPVTWINDANSKVKLSGMINMLLEIGQIRLNMWKGKYK